MKQTCELCSGEFEEKDMRQLDDIPACVNCYYSEVQEASME